MTKRSKARNGRGKVQRIREALGLPEDADVVQAVVQLKARADRMHEAMATDAGVRMVTLAYDHSTGRLFYALGNLDDLELLEELLENFLHQVVRPAKRRWLRDRLRSELAAELAQGENGAQREAEN